MHPVGDRLRRAWFRLKDRQAGAEPPAVPAEQGASGSVQLDIDGLCFIAGHLPMRNRARPIMMLG
jgi:hypothetical protein